MHTGQCSTRRYFVEPFRWSSTFVSPSCSPSSIVNNSNNNNSYLKQIMRKS